MSTHDVKELVDDIAQYHSNAGGVIAHVLRWAARELEASSDAEPSWRAACQACGRRLRLAANVASPETEEEVL